jgi:hypothetical protein
MDADADPHAVNQAPARSPFPAQRMLLLIAGGCGVGALVLTVIADVTWHSQPTVVQLPERLRQVPTLPSLPLPTDLPSAFPTGLPSGYPTELPSGFPTELPSGFPTEFPTDFPELPSLPDLPDLPGDN